MNFSFTEEQLLVAETASQFARNELAPRAAARDESGEFPTKELRKLGQLGLLGVNVPECFGGAEAGVIAYAMGLEAIAAADASVSIAMAVTNMVAETIVRFGNDGQKRIHVPRLTSGEYLAGGFALSEADAGSDPAAMKTRATKTASGYRLDGTKQWITSGDQAGLLVVWAKTDPEAGSRGISAFLVPQNASGFEAGAPEKKMGLNGSTTVPLRFDGCELPGEALLGREGEGFKIALAALDGGRIGIAAQACGVARAALDATVAHTKQRYQFNRPLAANQAIQFRLADVATELESARLLTFRAAWCKEKGRSYVREAAMAKLYASEMVGRACDAAVQLHGGYGYARELGVERLMRDARAQRIYEGTSEIQRIVIARELLAGAENRT